MDRTTLDRDHLMDSVHTDKDGKECSRTLIIGHPRCGKTTMARAIGGRVLHIDSLLKDMEWSALSDHIATQLDGQGSWIIEGCSGVRGLRKWLKRNQGLPTFKIIWLDKPFEEQTKGQIQFGKMCSSIWNECKQELKRRG